MYPYIFISFILRYVYVTFRLVMPCALTEKQTNSRPKIKQIFAIDYSYLLIIIIQKQNYLSRGRECVSTQRRLCIYLQIENVICVREMDH